MMSAMLLRRCLSRSLRSQYQRTMTVLASRADLESNLNKKLVKKELNVQKEFKRFKDFRVKKILFTRDELESKIMAVCKNHDKIDASKLSSSVYGFMIKRGYADKPPISYSNAAERIMLVLKLFDKIDPEKLTMESNFMTDLGLDSLDHVEVIMAIEDEFFLEILDVDAEKLLRPIDILNYLETKEECYKEFEHHDEKVLPK